MILAEDLLAAAAGHINPNHAMKVVAARHVDFNGKALCSAAAHDLLAPLQDPDTGGGMDAPVTLTLQTENVDGNPASCTFQVWIIGTTSAIPPNQR